MIRVMSGIITFIKKLFGPGRPLATSEALMVGAAAGAMTDEKSKLSIALERANDEPPARKIERTARAERLETPPPAEPIEAADAEEDAPVVKKAAKKRAPRKRKAAAADEDAVVAEPAPAPEPETAPAPARPRAAARAAEPAPTPVVDTRPARSDADVWMSDAVAWSLSGQWSNDNEMWTPPPGAEAPKRLEEFREMAADGKLVIWGRSGDVESWAPIEAAYWKSCGIEQFSFLEGREKLFTEPKTSAKPKGKGAEKYTALKVNRAQVEEVWQAGTMH